MARLNLTRPRIFSIALAAASLTIAACGGGSKSTSGGTAVPTAVPTLTPAPGVSASPCALSLGQAYEPDGGNAPGFAGLQVTRFEANTEQLCAAPPAVPAVINFQSSVEGLAFSPDFSDAVALLRGTAGGYSLVQDIYGAAFGQLVPAGNAYDLSIAPSPVPSGTVPLIPDATSATIVGSSTSGLALTLGPAATPPAIVAVTSLGFAPPQYGAAIPFGGGTYTLKNIPNVPRSIVRASGDGTVLLVRGAQDLLSFQISTCAPGYCPDAKADDLSLGFGSALALRGSGAMAFDPASSSRALVGGTSAGTSNVLSLVTGLPNAITVSSQIVLPGTVIRSIAIVNAGTYAVVGTDAGLSVVTGVSSGALSLVAAAPTLSALPYVDCLGRPTTMTNVYSVGFSAGNAAASSNFYLVALGSENPPPPVGGACVYPASIVAVPFNPTTGTLATPGPVASGSTAPPTTFTQNNVIPPPAGADLMLVH
ncbi:MAG: hypothetical protein M3R53_01040 [Candidatus Eremiobacteraeota bacterium]|nr:hypothetical protein [Candidatus Eremiobacteraeota bacterium]